MSQPTPATGNAGNSKQGRVVCATPGAPFSFLRQPVEHLKDAPTVAVTAATVNTPAPCHDATESVSSSVFRRDIAKIGREDGNSLGHGKIIAETSSEDPVRRVARLKLQHRLRQTPAVLWGNRADRSAALDKKVTQLPTKGAASIATPAATIPSASCTQPNSSKDGTLTSTQPPQASSVKGVAAGGKRAKMNGGDKRIADFASPISTAQASIVCDRTDAYSFLIKTGAEGFVAASLKRPNVVASVPLRWQARAVAFSSLQDQGVDNMARDLTVGPAAAAAGAAAVAEKARRRERQRKQRRRRSERMRYIHHSSPPILLGHLECSARATCLPAGQKTFAAYALRASSRTSTSLRFAAMILAMSFEFAASE